MKRKTNFKQMFLVDSVFYNKVNNTSNTNNVMVSNRLPLCCTSQSVTEPFPGNHSPLLTMSNPYFNSESEIKPSFLTPDPPKSEFVKDLVKMSSLTGRHENVNHRKNPRSVSLQTKESETSDGDDDGELQRRLDRLRGDNSDECECESSHPVTTHRPSVSHRLPKNIKAITLPPSSRYEEPHRPSVSHHLPKNIKAITLPPSSRYEDPQPMEQDVAIHYENPLHITYDTAVPMHEDGTQNIQSVLPLNQPLPIQHVGNNQNYHNQQRSPRYIPPLHHTSTENNTANINSRQTPYQTYTTPMNNATDLPSSRELYSKYRNAHEEVSTFICEICYTDFTTKSALYRHMKNIHEAYKQKQKGIKRKKSFTCDLCFSEFEKNQALERHIHNIHEHDFQKNRGIKRKLVENQTKRKFMKIT